MTSSVSTTPTRSPATRGTATRLRRFQPRRIRHVFSGSLLVALTVLMVLPLVMVVNISFRPSSDPGTSPLDPPSHIAWSNYIDVFHQMNYFTSLVNTLLITAASVALVVVTGSCSAWAIVRLARGWTTWTYLLFVSGLTIPVFVLLTPLFLLMRDINLLDNYLSVIISNAALNLPFAVFFYSSFLRSVPAELEDAAAVDGCGLVGIYWRIVFPLLTPATATLAILMSLGTWNDLVLPLVFLSSPEKSTVTLSVYSFLGTGGRFTTAQLFPAVVLATLPLFILFLALQRYIVAGITAGMGKS